MGLDHGGRDIHGDHDDHDDQDDHDGHDHKSSTDFDCDEDLHTWKMDWSRRKMAWCCKNEKKGCMAPAIARVPWGKAGLFAAAKMRHSRRRRSSETLPRLAEV